MAVWGKAGKRCGEEARWLHRNEKGQDLIEFAVSALVLLMLLAGIADFGGAFQQHIIVTNAAREGARKASRLPCLSINSRRLPRGHSQCGDR